MRRILVEQARRKKRQKHGGSLGRVDLDEAQWMTSATPEQMLSVDEALSKLAQEDPTAAEIVKLRYFAGVSLEEAAEMLGIHRATAYRHWAYARAWIRADVRSDSSPAE
jgi:RNA polymerase sigma factor (TIGR02999 family)